MRRSSLLGLATVLALAGVAGATENVVTKVTARAEGAKTVIVVHGSATPSFTAYRLERPARVVVDVADGKVAADDLRGGPVDVDTWAVGQIAMAQYADDASRTARLMIGFKRPSSYDVKAVGHDLVITVTANEPMPAEAARVDAAKLDEARKRRLQAEAQTAATEQRRMQAEQAEQAAVARAADAQREAEAARARALAAQDELERVTAARKAEEQRLGQVRAQATTATAQSQAERERVMREQQAEEARLEQLRAEAQALAKQRDVEARKLADTQAAARKAAEERQAKLVDIEQAARARQAASVAAQEAEQRRAQARAEEAARLAQAAQAAAQARSDEERARSSEAASREAENRAKQAMMRAQAAEAAARAEQARLEKMKADAAAQANAQAQAQAEVERARAELQKLTAAQAAERARAEAARRDAAELAAERAQAVERAQHAAALASGSLTKMAQAEREARRIADERAKESARLDAVRREMQAAADARARELARLDQARAEAQRIAEQRRAEEARLSAVSTQLAQTSTQLQQKSTQLQQTSTQLAQTSTQLQQTSSRLQQANDALTRKNDELTRTSSQLEQASGQLSRLAADEKAERARLAQAKADAARAQAELKKLDAERRAAAQAAEAQSSDARARIEAERAALQQKLAAAQAEVARATAEQQKKVQERAQLDAELKAARAELARLQAATRERLAMVPTPARMATVPAAAPASVPTRKMKDALPVEKVAARVRDVRFADDGDAERVIVDVGGSADAEVVRADERGAVLKIARADLPKKLERTLDASAFKGPIRSVSTYADSEDPGAVRVEVALAGDEPHAPPRLTRDNGTLTWEFPRSGTGTRSLPPPKMAPYGVSLPLQVAAAAPRGGRARKSYTGKRITLDLKDADIGNVLRLIADVGQVNMVVADNVKGTVTMSLKDVPWDQALDIILKSKGLGSVREGNVIRVAPETVLAKEVEEELARQKAAVELKPVETRLIGLSYADATQVLPRVSELLSPRGRASVDSRTNTLIITDVSANIGLAEDLVRNLDTQTPQVLIEARIVEARSTFLREVGIQWGGNTINSTATGNPTGIVFPSTVGVAGGATDNISNVQGLQLGSSGATSPNYAVNLPAPVGTGSGGALGLTLGSLNGNVNINLRLSSLENTGNVRIISAPKIMTLDNIEASIQQGVSIPISVVSAAGANTVFVDAKLNLTVKPHVTNEGSIVMNVHITRNEPDFVNTGARGDPTILKKEAKTEMLVRDGDTAVIGGIYTRNTGLSYSKVPWFADIPILGWLFKNKRENDDRTELLIFITPRIVNRAVVAR